MSDQSVYDFLNPGLYQNPDLAGLDYESAVEAMPRWYGVSFGNGNDGVSRSWPSFWVKTCEPYTLAAAGMLSEFTPGEGQIWCAENMQIDGEADYGIDATLYNPPGDREDYESELAEAQAAVDAAESEEEREEAEDRLREIAESDPGSWSEFNGAWRMCEVFPQDEPDTRAPKYTSLSDAFSPDLIALARES